MDNAVTAVAAAVAAVVIAPVIYAVISYLDRAHREKLREQIQKALADAINSGDIARIHSLRRRLLDLS